MDKKEDKQFRQPNITVTILKAAQDDISSLDILVCGTCQLVYHFIEEFKEHKAKKNCGASLLKVNISESKPQVWAFLLWKNSLPSKEQTESGSANSWHLYQRWCKMPESIRESWISAGRTIQSFTTLAKSKVNDLPHGSEEVQKVITVTMRPTDDLDDDEDTFDGFLKKDSDEPKNDKNITQINNSISIIEDTKIKDSTVVKALGEAITKISSPNVEDLLNPEITVIKQEKISDDEIAIEDKILKTNSIKRTPLGNEEILNTSEEEGEFVVEKILAKRFNPRRKSFEYLLKWEGYPAEQNTWEPVENMAACDKMVEAFEQNLARQKQLQMKTKGKVGRPRGPSLGGISKFQPIIETPMEPGPSGVSTPTGRRPVRSSKAKALETVKNWCGSMARREGEIGKRGRTSDSEDDEEDEKRIKLEPPDMDEWSQEDSDDSTFGEKKKKKGTGIRGRKPGTTVNGVAKRDLAIEIGLESPKKTNNTTQQPVLVANSQGVLKVDPRHVPNLTSGVYVVSNKTGIVKLSDKPTVIDTSKLPQSGIIRKPGTAIIQRTSIPGRSGGLFKLTSPKITKSGSTITRPIIPGTLRQPLVSPRILGSRVGLPSGVRPSIRATTAPLVRKNPINIPGITTKITSAVKPKGPGRPPIKPIQSLLGNKNSPSNQKIVGKKKEEEQPPSPKKDIFDGFEDDSSDDDGFDSMPDFPMEDLGPIKPDSPPRPLTLCPITGKILSRAEGEPTPPPSPEPGQQMEEIKDEFNEETMYKVEMSPGGTTGMVINADIDDPALIETLRETHGITVVGHKNVNVNVTKIDDSKDASEDTNDSSTNHSGGGGINLPARKLYVDADGMHVNSENSEGGEIVTITGEDGTVYHLASSGDGTHSDLSNGGVISVDSEGQQCVYVTAEQEEEHSQGGESEVLTLDTAVAEAVAQLLPEQVVSDSSGQIYVKNEPVESNDTEGQEQQQIIISESGDDTTQAEIVAQIVQDDLIAGEGGTRRVVLLLPDGNLMMTEVDQEQYDALDLGK